MDNFGFIHGELDIKILILFILRRLPAPVDGQTLTDLCACDTGVSYFDYTECLDHLTETGHVEALSGGRYVITEKGARNGQTIESSLPFSVRSKVQRMIAPLAERMRRDNMIKTDSRECEGNYMVALSLSDDKGEILKMELLAADEPQAERMKTKFRREAESLYGTIVQLLSE